MEMEDYKTVHNVAVSVIEAMPMGCTFSGADFKARCVSICPDFQYKYIASLLRPIWDYNRRANKECGIICINKAKSLYKKVDAVTYDKHYLTEEKVLITKKRFAELLEKEKFFDKESAKIKKYRSAKQLEFAF